MLTTSHDVTLVQIVSGAPPQVNGVTDYAMAVARDLRAAHGIESVLLVCNPEWTGPTSIDGFRLLPFRTRQAEDLANALGELSHEVGTGLGVLVQLSPYGYSPSGAPFWLLRGLEAFMRKAHRHRLLVYFHELYATSAPWRRGFWLSPFQRSFARQTARRTAFSLTSMQIYVDQIRSWNSGPINHHGCLAVPSNVGEPAGVSAIDTRRAQLVVFGTVGLRARAYGKQEALLRVCDRLGIETVVDVGPGTPDGINEFRTVPVQRLGQLPAPQVSEILDASKFAYLDYFSGYLAKSGVFAAYCAHGVVPVFPEVNHSEGDGVTAGRQYWHPQLGALDDTLARRISTEVRDWYLPHRVAAHAAWIASALSEAE